MNSRRRRLRWWRGNQRVFPKDGFSFLIAGNDNAFDAQDPLNLPQKETEILNSVKKLEEVKKIKHLKNYKLALPANTMIKKSLSALKKLC
jgi:hypothetical protein